MQQVQGLWQAIGGHLQHAFDNPASPCVGCCVTNATKLPQPPLRKGKAFGCCQRQRYWIDLHCVTAFTVVFAVTELLHLVSQLEKSGWYKTMLRLGSFRVGNMCKNSK